MFRRPYIFRLLLFSKFFIMEFHSAQKIFLADKICDFILRDFLCAIFKLHFMHLKNVIMEKMLRNTKFFAE